MIDIHSKYDNMHKNEMFYTLICINNHIISCIIHMLSKLNKNDISYMKCDQLVSCFFLTS